VLLFRADWSAVARRWITAAVGLVLVCGVLAYHRLYDLEPSQIAVDHWFWLLLVVILGVWLLGIWRASDWVVAIESLPDGSVCFVVWTPFGRRRRIWRPGQPRMTVTLHENVGLKYVDPYFELTGWGRPLHVDAWGQFPQGAGPLLPLTDGFFPVIPTRGRRFRSRLPDER
jgi:hypothetical protein